jgi:predicted phosphoribosyltransferase
MTKSNRRNGGSGCSVAMNRSSAAAAQVDEYDADDHCHPHGQDQERRNVLNDDQDNNRPVVVHVVVVDDGLGVNCM